VAPPAAIHEGSYSSQSARQGGTWAVVIGINDYPGGSDDLNSAVNDAEDVAQAMRTLGVGNDHMLMLRDGQATRGTLLQAVSWLAAHAGPDAVAGFFYAGHVRKTPNGNEEIVTSDGTSVTDGELANALNRVQATRSWVAIAACYGGGFDEVLRPGRVLTAAAGRNSLAYENSALGRSYMVEYMVRQAMIQGRASATVQTAFNYAVDRISREHPGREPVQIDNSNGALDLRPPGADRASEPQPEPETAPSAPPADEPPASDRPPSDGSQQCSKKGLFHICSNG
ncbi:MAG: metacaspase, partial [Actinomycetota bacterium]